MYVIRYNFKYSLRIGGRGERGGELAVRERGGGGDRYVRTCLSDVSLIPVKDHYNVNILCISIMCHIVD